MWRDCWGQVDAWQQCLILEIPSEHRCQVALVSPACPVGGGLPSPCSQSLVLSPCRQTATPMPWDQAGFLFCLLPGATWGIPHTLGPRGTH